MMVDKNMSILVVDDFQTMTQLMRYLLLSLGFKNVDEARDGRVSWGEGLPAAPRARHDARNVRPEADPMTGMAP